MITILYLYYNQPKAIKFFEKLGYHNLDIPFLFVDDASTTPLDLSHWKNATVLRIEKDVPWNQPAANNLAFQYLYKNNPESVVLRMDIDHYFTPSQLQNVAKIQLQDNQIIHFTRKNIAPHPNLYMAKVEHLLKAGGYNTDFCGNYGYDDKEFMHRLRRRKLKFITVPISVNTNHKVGTKNLDRDTTINQIKYKALTQ